MSAPIDLLLFLTWLLVLESNVPLTAAIGENVDEKCPFEDTVNLTNIESFENGSYLYRDILIPPAKQSFYDYVVQFLGQKKSVAMHLRGCVCEKRPCFKMCCAEDEYFNDTESINSCQKLTPDMNSSLSWDLSMDLYDDDNPPKIVNIFNEFTIQFGLPSCQYPEVIDLTLDRWSLQEDGTVFVEVDYSQLDTLKYCFSPRLNDYSGGYTLAPYSCPMKNEASWRLLLTTYAMALSVLFLIPTIVVYLILKELRGNLRGKLLICYLLSLTIGYAIISFINISSMRFGIIACSTLGFTCYFFFMSAFLWLSVLCFDIWMNFKETNVELNSHKNRKQFIIYSLYAWLTAGMATGLLIYIQFSPTIEDDYKPGIGIEMCWLNTNKWMAAVYFYGPNLVILLFNFVTFAHLTARIYNVRRDLARMTHKEKFFQENAVVILRLFLIMGISWLFDIMSYCVRDYEKWDFLFVLSDFANALQGILIFSLFVLKPNVLNLLKKRFQRTQSGRARKNFWKLQNSTTCPTPVTP